MLYRLWKDGEDYGTAGERVAKWWLEYALSRGENVKIQAVPDGSPKFLPTTADLPPRPDAASEAKEP